MARKVLTGYPNDAGTATVYGGDDLGYINRYLTGIDQSGTDPVTVATTTTFNEGKAVIPNLGRKATYTLYIAGTIVKVRNTITGLIDTTADNTVDAVPAIAYALNNIQNITGAGLSPTYGGAVKIASGVYKCTSNLLVSDQLAASNRIGNIIEGEGVGTHLNFVPASTITDAITISSAQTQINNLAISLANTVTNGIRISAITPNTTGWQGARGQLAGLTIQGSGWGSTFSPTIGQIGIIVDGTTGTPFPFHWRILNCNFAVLDIGIMTTGLYSTSTFQDNNSFLYVNNGIFIDSAQHQVTNMWHQGTNGGGGIGKTAVRLGANALHNIVQNLTTEMQLDWAAAGANDCQAVVLDSGAARNQLMNIRNDQADPGNVAPRLSQTSANRFVIVDNSGNNTNTFTYMDDGDGRGHFQTKMSDDCYTIYSSMKAGVSSGAVSAFDIFPTISNSFGIFRIGNTQSGQVSTDSVRADFRLCNNDQAGVRPEYCEWEALGTVGYLIHATRGQDLSSNFGFTRPVILGSDGYFMLTMRTDLALDTNNCLMTGVSQDPTVKKFGKVTPMGNGAQTNAGVLSLSELLSNITMTQTNWNEGTPATLYDTTEGIYANLLTNTTQNHICGIPSPTTGVGLCRRLFGARIRVRFKVDAVASSVSRFYFGWSSAATLPTTDNPLAVGDNGIIVGFGASSTNWSIYHNDATTSVTVDNVTGPIAKDTNWHTIEIGWLSGGTINVGFDAPPQPYYRSQTGTGQPQTISTDLPATTANLFFHCELQKADAAAAARTLSLRGIMVEVDK